jgi:hypothetical protein
MWRSSWNVKKRRIWTFVIAVIPAAAARGFVVIVCSITLRANSFPAVVSRKRLNGPMTAALKPSPRHGTCN